MAESETALERLQRGNATFQERVSADEPRSTEPESGQRSVAIVVGCADSPVGPETVFDARPGELFVVRNAGNLANPVSMASVEFAVAHLHPPLIVVLAHESCVAVEAAIEGGHAGKSLSNLYEHIEPAIHTAGDNSTDTVARRSAQRSAERLLTQSTIVREAVERDGLRVVAAFFNSATGAVEFT